MFLLVKTNLVKWAALAMASLSSATMSTAAPAGDDSNLLWYDKPATKWTEALPVGNGRLSAMVFGGAGQERLQLNEGTLWAGGPYDPVNPEAKEALPQVRQLVNEGKFREAAQLISAKVMAKPLGQMPYQTVGDLLLTFPGATNPGDYRRELKALYYQFGRYLLISCSRPGGQPATLQGLWNESMNPPWQSKYTININSEMNYWPAESGNLAE